MAETGGLMLVAKIAAAAIIVVASRATKRAAIELFFPIAKVI